MKKRTEKKEKQFQADELLRKKYKIDNRKIRELRRFVKSESFSGFPIEVIVNDLTNEGWDKTVIKKFVEAYHNPMKIKPPHPISKGIAWAISLILVSVFVSFGILLSYLYAGNFSLETPSSATGMDAEQVSQEQALDYYEPVLQKKELFKLGDVFTYHIESDYIYKYAYIVSSAGKTLKFFFVGSGKDRWIKGSATLEVPITSEFSDGKNRLIIKTCVNFAAGECYESRFVYHDFTVDKKEEGEYPQEDLSLEEKIVLRKSLSAGKESDSGPTGGSSVQCNDDDDCDSNQYCDNNVCKPLAAAPKVFNTNFYQSPVRADPQDLLLIQGNGFESGAAAVYKKVSDKPGTLSSPSLTLPSSNSDTEGTLYVEGVTNDSVTVLLPNVTLSKQTYALWLKNTNGAWSEQILINDPRPLWISPIVAYETKSFANLSREIKVVGRNLENHSSGGIMQIRLNGPSIYNLTAVNDRDPNTTIENYVAKASLSANITPGIYTVQYSRDETNWISVPSYNNLTVLPNPAVKTVYNISDYGGCSPDDGIDDTRCVVNAVGNASAAGGGEVFFPAGAWNLSPNNTYSDANLHFRSGIIVDKNIDLVGEGRNETTIMKGLSWNTSTENNIDTVFTLQGDNIVRDIHFASQGWNEPLSGVLVYMALGRIPGQNTSSDPYEIYNVSVYNNNFTDMYFSLGSWGLPVRRLIVTKNDFQPYRQSLRFSASSNQKHIIFTVEDSVITNNTFYPGDYSDDSQGTMVSSFSGAQRMDISDNLANGSVNGGWRAALFWNSLGPNEQVLISKNTLTCTGDKTGDGEAIIFDDNGNAVGFTNPRNITSFSSNSVTINGTLREGTDSFYNEHWVYIADGKGLGQARKIINYTNATPSLVYVSPDWDVIPDKTSKVLIARSSWQTYMVDNIIDIRGCLKNNPTGDDSGLIGWATTTSDGAIEGNQLYESNGIVLNTNFAENRTQIIYSCEVRNNIVDEEYKLPDSIGGINLWFAANPEIANPVMGYNVLVSHNTVNTSDTSNYRSGIGFIPRSTVSATNYTWKSTLVFHNNVDNTSRGIYIVNNFTWYTALYKNNFSNLDKDRKIHDNGTGSLFCGNNIVEFDESCDDGLLEECAYGETSCQVCSAQCDGLIAGNTSYCGDGRCDIQRESTTSCVSDCGTSCPSNGLLHSWTADGITADQYTIKDEIGTNDGSFVNATLTTGHVNQAFNFDGQGDYIKTGDSTAYNFTGLTFMAWVNTTPSTTDDLIILGNLGSGLSYVWFIDRSSNRTSLHLGGTTIGETRILGANNVPSNVWTHVAVTWNSTDGFRIYQNGTFINNDTTTVNSTFWGGAATSGFTIGVDRTTSPINFFNGSIDEVHVWTRVLNSSEIQSVFDAGISGMCNS